MDPVSTYLPILKAFGIVFEGTRKILEFGGGFYSTSTFLNKIYFPFLENLTTVEIDPDWKTTLLKKYHEDARFSILTVDHVQHLIGTQDWDLIFIDDGKNVTERTKTIKTVTSLRPSCPVIIHDFEIIEYKIESRKFDNRYTFTQLVPNTAILWNGSIINNDTLYKLIEQTHYEVKLFLGEDNDK